MKQTADTEIQFVTALVFWLRYRAQGIAEKHPERLPAAIDYTLRYTGIASKMTTVRGLEFALALDLNNRNMHYLHGGNSCDIPHATMTETMLYTLKQSCA